MEHLDGVGRQAEDLGHGVAAGGRGRDQAHLVPSIDGVPSEHLPRPVAHLVDVEDRRNTPAPRRRQVAGRLHRVEDHHVGAETAEDEARDQAIPAVEERVQPSRATQPGPHARERLTQRAIGGGREVARHGTPRPEHADHLGAVVAQGLLDLDRDPGGAGARRVVGHYEISARCSLHGSAGPDAPAGPSHRSGSVASPAPWSRGPTVAPRLPVTRGRRPWPVRRRQSVRAGMTVRWAMRHPSGVRTTTSS
jgi:hypothetical protein